MRRILTGLLACVLTLGLFAAGQAEAKVYKMKPEERAAALKEKKARKAKKKSGKANAAAPGGWVEVKPGTKPERKARKSAKVEEAAKPTKAAEHKGKKGKKADVADTTPERKSEKKAAKATKAAKVVKTEKKSGKRARKDAAAKGDRLVGKSYSGETKVRGAGIEVRRSGSKARHAAPDAAPGENPAASTSAAPAGDSLNGYSVQRPGQEKPSAPAAAPAPAVTPEVRQQVQPGPVDASKPVGTEQKSGEGRF